MRRDYMALWGILAVTFVLFLTLSMCDEISIGTWHPRSSGMAEALTGGQHETAEPADTVSTDDATSGTSQVELDTLPKTVLIIGDSMLEGLSPRLAAYCASSGHTLYSVIWYSSTTEQYGKTHLIADYIDVLKPDYIFISLGGNELFVRDIAEKRDKYIKEILREIGDIPYLWIGPPNWKADTGINTLIENNATPGCYFRSEGMEFERKKDGAHPTSASAAAWMDSIVHWMPGHAHYVMSMHPYQQPNVRPKRYYIHQPGELTQRPK